MTGIASHARCRPRSQLIMASRSYAACSQIALSFCFCYAGLLCSLPCLSLACHVQSFELWLHCWVLPGRVWSCTRGLNCRPAGFYHMRSCLQAWEFVTCALHGLFGPTDHQAGRTAIKTMMMTSVVELFTRWHMNTVPLVEQ